VRGTLIGGVDFGYDEDDKFKGDVDLGRVALLGDFYPL
jgi:hypothetical protein